MPKWTSEQRRAIDETGDILVSAGAGSGKTAVLTERIVRLVREGLDIRQILCVTFTIAAANEMKKRIERALYQAAAASRKEAEAARLNEAARESASAAISTLHSFCTQVLRRHFNEAGLDPNFRVADESEAALLREAAWDELCETRLLEDAGLFASLLEAVGGDAEAFSIVNELHAFCRAQPDPLGFLARAQALYGASSDELCAGEAVAELLMRTQREFRQKASALARARDALAANCPQTAAFLDEELLHARMVALQKTPEDMAAALLTGPHAEKARISWRGCPQELRGPAERAREKLGDIRKKEAAFWQRGISAQAALLSGQRPLVAELFESVRDFSVRFARLKRERSVIDYGDMEQFALALLQKEAIALEYRARFAYVFMDEYQDANAVQEEIIRAIASPGALFLVGDVKQSIYRFRLAEPALFIRRYLDYSDPARGCRIDLSANFRSAPGVIEAVNAVFARLMREETAELAYDERARLVHGREEACPPSPDAVEFLFADLLADFPGQEENSDLPAAEEESEEEAAPTEEEPPRAVAQAEAALAAQRIRIMMETGSVFDPRTGARRAPRYGDFAVLLRSYKNAAEDWLTTLALEGIPAYGEAAGGFFDAVEVRLFMDLLRVIDNRSQSIPLAAVLRSPIGGFCTEELIELRTAYTSAGADPASPWRLFDSLLGAAEDEGELGSKARAFLAKLARWQELAGLVGVHAFIGALLDETDYGLFCRALPGGKQREGNLEALCEKARRFEASGFAGLHAFLNYAEKLRALGTSEAAQSVGADVVRVMSIHASKGLEFPFVILAGLGCRFNREHQKKALLCDPALGVAVRFRLAGVRTHSLYARAIAARSERKGLAEEMRVLYVAMTRAREKLLLLCAAPRGDQLIEKASLLSPETAEGDSYAQWLLSCILNASEGAELRARYGLRPLPGAKPLGIAVSAEVCTAPAGSFSRMGEAAYERFRQEALDSPAPEALFQRDYAHCADTQVPSKVSVTGLAGHELKLTEAPDFLLAARMTPADRGTAYHALMQHIALRPHGAQSVLDELSRLVEEGKLTKLQAEAVDVSEIAAFFASPLGLRLCEAAHVRREVAFNISLSARALELSQSSAPVILQGVIDCCFLENGKWVLVDYKTDSVPPGPSMAELANRHARQVNLYAHALEKLTGTPVASRMIYFFSPRAALEVKKGIDL